MRVPKLCKHKGTGRGYVRLGGRQIYLGTYGTKECEANYRRALADWAANGSAPRVDPTELTCIELAARFMAWNRTQGYAAAHLNAIRLAVTRYADIHNDEPAASFGPNKLRALRAQWAAEGLSARTCQYYTGHIKRMYKWAVGRELLPANAYHGLQALEALRQGRDVPRRRPVQPVAHDVVEQTLEHLPPVLRDMVRLQVLTGARPGEICGLTPGAIDTSGDVWEARLERHKTSHHGKTRILYFGPKSQTLLKPYLLREATAPLFDPREAVRQRAAACDTHRRPTQPDDPRKTDREVGDRYSSESYRRAITRACDDAGVERWSPNQLRHLAAVEARSRWGLDGAQVLLGHSAANITEIYAGIDQAKAREIARERG